MNENKNISTLQQFGILTHQMFQIIGRKTSLENVSPESPFLLHIVEKKGPLTQKEIADKMKIRPATLTVRLQRMEKLGWIIRENDENDKRIQRVSITEEGKWIVRECYKTFESVAKAAFEGFSDEEQQELINFLERMNSNVEKYAVKGNE